jgi:hypothetical protein
MNQKLSLDTKLSDCGIEILIVTILTSANISTLGELASQNKNDFLRSFNVGKSALNQLEDLLRKHELDWGTRFSG